MDKISLSYEEAIKKLEEILINIENNDLKLEVTLEKFKEAMDLYSYCNGILTKAEGSVKQIMEKEDGLLEKDFPAFFREDNDGDY